MARQSPIAPRLDPQVVVRLLNGRVPALWFSSGYCQGCGPVLLLGKGWDYGVLPTCPWCLVRQSGRSIPLRDFVQARLREHGPQLPDYFQRAYPPQTPAIGRERTPLSAAAFPPTASPTAGRAGSFLPSDALPRATVGAEVASLKVVDDVVGPIAEVPHHPQDARWIESQLARLVDPRVRVRLRCRYGQTYQAAFEAEPHPVRKEGKARFAANSALRDAVVRLEQDQHPLGVPDGFQ